MGQPFTFSADMEGKVSIPSFWNGSGSYVAGVAPSTFAYAQNSIAAGANVVLVAAPVNFQQICIVRLVLAVDVAAYIQLTNDAGGILSGVRVPASSTFVLDYFPFGRIPTGATGLKLKNAGLAAVVVTSELQYLLL